MGPAAAGGGVLLLALLVLVLVLRRRRTSARKQALLQHRADGASNSGSSGDGMVGGSNPGLVAAGSRPGAADVALAGASGGRAASLASASVDTTTGYLYTVHEDDIEAAAAGAARTTAISTHVSGSNVLAPAGVAGPALATGAAQRRPTVPGLAGGGLVGPGPGAGLGPAVVLPGGSRGGLLAPGMTNSSPSMLVDVVVDVDAYEPVPDVPPPQLTFDLNDDRTLRGPAAAAGGALPPAGPVGLRGAGYRAP